MSYRPEWIPGVLVALIVLLSAPPLAMVALLILVLVALALVLALAGAVAATPYLLFRSVRSRWAHHVADRRNPEPPMRGLRPVSNREM
jgi:hypothetical protein